MRLAVFTTRYPARGATFFRRDMSALVAAGAIGASAARYGAVPFAKSAYVIPKAWAWAAATP